MRSRAARQTLGFVVTSLLVMSACGGSDDGDDAEATPAPTDAATSEPDGDDASATEATEEDDRDGGSAAGFGVAPPAGQAVAAVDGVEVTLDLPGALACTVADDTITYSFRVGDNEITLGAGANRVDGGWMGNISFRIANPDGEAGPITYYPAPGDLGVLDDSLFAIDGDTVWYSGPMLKQPANDGSLPPPVEVGNGTIAATCP